MSNGFPIFPFWPNSDAPSSGQGLGGGAPFGGLPGGFPGGMMDPTMFSPWLGPWVEAWRNLAGMTMGPMMGPMRADFSATTPAEMGAMREMFSWSSRGRPAQNPYEHLISFSPFAPMMGVRWIWADAIERFAAFEAASGPAAAASAFTAAAKGMSSGWSAPGETPGGFPGWGEFGRGAQGSGASGLGQEAAQASRSERERAALNTVTVSTASVAPPRRLYDDDGGGATSAMSSFSAIEGAVARRTEETMVAEPAAAAVADREDWETIGVGAIHDMSSIDPIAARFSADIVSNEERESEIRRRQLRLVAGGAVESVEAFETQKWATGGGRVDAAETRSEDPAAGEQRSDEAVTWSADAEGPRRKPYGLYDARPVYADDLKRIRGIGPRLEQLLNELGVFTFSQIAEFSVEELRWVDAHLFNFKGRALRDQWVEQARRLIEDDTEQGYGDGNE